MRDGFRLVLDGNGTERCTGRVTRAKPDDPNSGECFNGVDHENAFAQPAELREFDGGASSRWPATREIQSFWYPVWLTYPAGMLPGSRLLDAPPHKITTQQTIEISKDYEFLVLFTSTVGFDSDLQLARKMKEVNPSSEDSLCRPGRPNQA